MVKPCCALVVAAVESYPLEGAMRPYNIVGWTTLAQESVTSTLLHCYSYQCPTT